MKCGALQHKKEGLNDGEYCIFKGSPSKVLCYLPIILRPKRLFANNDDAQSLTWYVDRVINGKSRHQSISPHWKMIDGKYPIFGGDVRNLWFGLCIDGINHHSNLSIRHSL